MEITNKLLKDKAAPGAMAVIEWAGLVHENTMQLLQDHTLTQDQRTKLSIMFTWDEREEARKLLIEYGAGKPTRIVQHVGDKKKPICFETEIVRTNPALPEHTDNTIDAEVLNEASHT